MEPFKEDSECNSKNLDFFFFGILKNKFRLQNRSFEQGAILKSKSNIKPIKPK